MLRGALERLLQEITSITLSGLRSAGLKRTSIDSIVNVVQSGPQGLFGTASFQRVKVTTGVPQGSILRPLLLFVLANTLMKLVYCQMSTRIGAAEFLE